MEPYAEQAQKFLELLQNDTAPWQGGNFGRTLSPFNPRTGTVYSGINRVVLSHMIFLVVRATQNARQVFLWATMANPNETIDTN